MVPADSHSVSRAPRYSGFRDASLALRVRSSHPLRRAVPGASPHARGPTPRPYTPAGALMDAPRFGLAPVRSPLLGGSLLFSLPGGTKMFQFPPFASAAVRCGWPPFRRPGCPIRRPAGQRSFAPHRGLSQLIASFIASMSQGIRHAPFPTFLATGLPETLVQGREPELILSAVLLKKTLVYLQSCLSNMSKISRVVENPKWRISGSNR